MAERVSRVSSDDTQIERKVGILADAVWRSLQGDPNYHTLKLVAKN